MDTGIAQHTVMLKMKRDKGYPLPREKINKYIKEKRKNKAILLDKTLPQYLGLNIIDDLQERYYCAAYVKT